MDVEQSSTQLRFSRAWRPAWAWVLAPLLLPVAGLVLLVANVRRAFAELSV